MTLVEVIAGLALLALVLGGLLVVKARATHQALITERRHEAAIATDALLSDWWRDTTTLPRSGHGEMAGDLHLRWRTQTRADAQAALFGAEIVRLEVSADPSSIGGPPQPPLVAVELVLPRIQEHETRIHAH